MRRYLLDTSVLSAPLQGNPTVGTLLRPALDRHEVATSILVYAEVVEYLKGRADFPARRAALHDLLDEVRPLLLAYPMLERYADIRRALRPPRGPGLIGDVDTLIAATALERNLTIVTTDTDFARVPELLVELVERRPL